MNFNNYNNSYGQPKPPSILEVLKNFFKSKSLLSRLIIINVAIYILVNIFDLGLFLLGISPSIVNGVNVLSSDYWLAVPADLNVLATKPWTVITYMFYHKDFWHLFVNMLMLYFGGVMFTQSLGTKKLLTTYFIGGLFGALFYIGAFNLFPAFKGLLPMSVALGASASVLAIIIGSATYRPDYPVYLFFFYKIKLKYVAFIFILVDLFSISRENPGGHIAHIGGAFFGFIYVLTLKQGLNLNSISYRIKKAFKPKPKFTKTVNYTTYQKPVSNDDFNYNKVEHQKKIDAILDKISKSGYEALSKEDKDLLFKESNKGTK